MHIVLANQWFPPESGWGGVAMYNRTMAHAFRQLGHQVTVITKRLQRDVPEVSDADGVRIKRLLVDDAYRWRRLPFVGRYVRGAQQLAYARRVNAALRQLHRQQPIDVVEFAEVNAEGFFFARNPIAPFVVRCHTPTSVLRDYFQPDELDYDTRVISACEKDLIRRAAARTAPSHDMAHIIASTCGVALEQIAVIPNALSVAAFDGPQRVKVTQGSADQVTVLYVGRFERVKGILVLADAIPQVIKRLPNTRFLLAGYDRSTLHRGSQRAEIDDRLTRAGVRGQVEFLEAVEQNCLPLLYQRADLCVVPSLLYESFSYTCAQAMAFGRPVIASRIGGIPETVDDGVCGMIVEPANTEQLADAIVQLARDRAVREAMGRAGREKAVREFDPVRVAEQNLEIYGETIEKYKKSKR